MEKIIKEILTESTEVKNKVMSDLTLIERIEKVALLILEAYQKRKKVVLFGNGGSAADAQHIAGELVNRFRIDRVALPAIALTTDTSVLTSIANDYDFSKVFARQVQALVTEGDVVIGISTGGKSSNVLEGIKMAQGKGAVTVGFTGRNGGRLAEMVDLAVKVPSDETPRVQEAHITILHIICYLVERELFGENT